MSLSLLRLLLSNGTVGICRQEAPSRAKKEKSLKSQHSKEKQRGLSLKREQDSKTEAVGEKRGRLAVGVAG